MKPDASRLWTLCSVGTIRLQWWWQKINNGSEMKKILLVLALSLCGCGSDGGQSAGSGSGSGEEVVPEPVSVVGSYGLSADSAPVNANESVKIIVFPDLRFFLVESIKSENSTDQLPARLDVYHGSLSGAQSFSSRFIRYFEMDDGEEGVGSLSPVDETENAESVQIMLNTGILFPGSYAGPPAEDGSITGYRVSSHMLSSYAITRNVSEEFGLSLTGLSGSYDGVLKSSQGSMDVTLSIGNDGNIELSGLEDGCSLTGTTSFASGALPVELAFVGSGCLMFPAQSMNGILLNDNGYLMIIAFDGTGRFPVYFGSSLQ